jgi:thiosulfate/3-mercaptopyruvate sulfurtransferase
MPKIQLTSALVSVQWLAENHLAENLVILDASMKPATSMQVEERDLYIAGARRFDFDKEIYDKNSPLPHMMPTAEDFAFAVQALGINEDSAVIVYDKVNIYSSPRAWMMFRAMGHAQVAVLDGGLPAWIRAGYKVVENISVAPKRGNFTANPMEGVFIDSKKTLSALSDPNYVVMDARSAGRFNGTEPEPRAGLRGGHMPGSVNLPFGELLENGMMRSPSQLQALFKDYQDKKMIFSCGSGATACILALGATQAGLDSLAVYDGSWSEWGAMGNDLPVV